MAPNTLAGWNAGSSGSETDRGLLSRRDLGRIINNRKHLQIIMRGDHAQQDLPRGNAVAAHWNGLGPPENTPHGSLC